MAKKQASKSSNVHGTVAGIASQLMPPMELPARWKELATAYLAEELRKDILPSAPSLPSRFEVMAEAAVARARILLDVAAGIKRPERILLEQKTAERQEAHEKKQKTRTDLSKIFAKLSPAGTPLLLDAVITAALPRRTSAKMRDAFIRRVREKRINDEHVSREDFPKYYSDAKAMWDEDSSALRKSLSRAAGKKGKAKSMQP